MITEKEFDELVRDTLRDVGANSPQSGDASARLIYRARQGHVDPGRRPQWIAALAAAAAVAVVAVVIAVTDDRGSGTSHPATTVPTPTVPTPTMPTLSSLPSTSTPPTSSTPTHVTSAPNGSPGSLRVRFDGIGAITLGMHGAQLDALGFGGQALTDGCVQYTAFGGDLYVTLDPREDAVVAVAAVYPKHAYRTDAGISLGATVDEVRAAYPADAVESHLDGSFGQGGDGLLVSGPGGWIGFTITSGKVSALKVGDHDRATGMEIGC